MNSTIFYWSCGPLSTRGTERSEHPIDVAASKAARNIYDRVLADRKVKERDIVEAKSISQGSVVSNLNDLLGMK